MDFAWEIRQWVLCFCYRRCAMVYSCYFEPSDARHGCFSHDVGTTYKCVFRMPVPFGCQFLSDASSFRMPVPFGCQFLSDASSFRMPVRSLHCGWSMPALALF